VDDDEAEDEEKTEEESFFGKPGSIKRWCWYIGGTAATAGIIYLIYHYSHSNPQVNERDNTNAGNLNTKNDVNVDIKITIPTTLKDTISQEAWNQLQADLANAVRQCPHHIGDPNPIVYKFKDDHKIQQPLKITIESGQRRATWRF